MPQPIGTVKEFFPLQARSPGTYISDVFNAEKYAEVAIYIRVTDDSGGTGTVQIIPEGSVDNVEWHPLDDPSSPSSQPLGAIGNAPVVGDTNFGKLVRVRAIVSGAPVTFGMKAHFKL